MGGAAGGVVGAAAPGGGLASALAGVGGALVGGLVGSAAEHAAGDTRAFEYVVRTGGRDLLSVTQRDTVPLAIGQKVLLIAGTQARIVPDYTAEPAAQRAAVAPATPSAGQVTAERPATGPGGPAERAGGLPPTPPAPVVVAAPPSPAVETRSETGSPRDDVGGDPVGQAIRAALPGSLSPIAEPLANEVAGPRP